jgi:hypothetical protein
MPEYGGPRFNSPASTEILGADLGAFRKTEFKIYIKYN